MGDLFKSQEEEKPPEEKSITDIEELDSMIKALTTRIKETVDQAGEAMTPSQVALFGDEKRKTPGMLIDMEEYLRDYSQLGRMSIGITMKDVISHVYQYKGWASRYIKYLLEYIHEYDRISVSAMKIIQQQKFAIDNRAMKDATPISNEPLKPDEEKAFMRLVEERVENYKKAYSLFKQSKMNRRQVAQVRIHLYSIARLSAPKRAIIDKVVAMVDKELGIKKEEGEEADEAL